ncbi:MAG: ATP-binding cassette domain-containing protein [Methanobacteriaceae archaeon]|nr:ATP-binding cassette domain-containing protein [Methanobacteriaceae archaeon]
MNTLKAENISYGYTSKHKVLDNVNFEMTNDKVIGLFGDSGSGKSTFCKILTGFIKNYEGRVTVNGEGVTSGFNPIQLIYQHPEKIMNPRWNMRQVLTESWMPPEDVLDTFGIKEEWFKRFPSELSGGELQRFSILRAMNPRTKFIIADEITTMLDAVTQVQILDSLLTIVRERDVGVLLVSHDKRLLNRVTDDIVYLDDLNK